MATEANLTHQLTISADRCRAVLTFLQPVPAAPDPVDLLAKLAELGVPDSPELEARVHRACELLVGKIRRGDELVLTAGQPAVAGTPDRFELAERFRAPDPSASGPVDFHQSQMPTVRSGEAVGRIISGSSPQPGIDVFGEPIPAPPRPDPIAIGEQLIRHNDGTIITKVAGMLETTDTSVMVRDAIEIAGDVDFNTGDVEAPASIAIAGSIRATFTVHAEGSIRVGGSIEAARVHASGHIEAVGGISGQNSGIVIAGGRLTAKFCNGVHLRAGDDVVLTRGCVNSWLRTEGRLVIEQGALVGGSAWARGGAMVHVLGSDAGVPTRLICGTDPAWLDTSALTEQLALRRRQAAQRIHDRIRDLLEAHGDLSEAQRHAAEDLLRRAEGLNAQADGLDHLIEQRGESSGEPPQVLVQSRLHEGTLVAIDGLACLFEDDVPGPVTISRVQTEGGNELAMVEARSRRRTILPAMQFVPEPSDLDGLPVDMRLQEVFQELAAAGAIP